MTLEKRYTFKGLNLRNTSITRDSGFASDLRNVELNDRRELIKRKGFDSVVTQADLLDLYEYKRGDQLLGQFSSGVKYFDSIWTDIPYGNPSNTKTWTTPADSSEYNGVVYFTDPDLENDLYKFDGDYFYKAGMKRAGAPIDAIPTGTNYFRYFYKTIDAQFNSTMGDYYQLSANTTTPSVKLDVLADSEYKTRFAIEDSVANDPKKGEYTNADVSIDLEYLAGHNILPDTWMMIKVVRTFENTVEFPCVNIRVSAVSGNTVTLDLTTLSDGDAISVAGFNATPFIDASLGSISVNVYYSIDETFGYFKTDEFLLIETDSPTDGEQIYPLTNLSQNYSLNLTVFLEDEYDSTIIKGEPPKCKYITMYNNVMVLANTKDKVSRNRDKTSSIFWSDTGVGSTVETFPPFNVDEVGKSSEGEITGLKALSDNVVIGKERQIYYMNGNLILQSYRIRSALTNGIGCVSFRSMKEIEGGVLFMSSRGMYLARHGSKPVELSDIIEPLFRRFTELELSQAKTINDIKNEKLLIYIPSSLGDYIVVYDYLYKEWFLHDGINASSGIQFLGESLYHADSTDMYLRSDQYNDNGLAINGYYRSNWEDMGYPSMKKKWKKFVVLCLDTITWTLNLKTQHNWTDTDVTDELIDLSGPMVDDRSIDMKQTKSMRIEMANNVKDEGMLITGYEFEFEYTQERPKGNS